MNRAGAAYIFVRADNGSLNDPGDDEWGEMQSFAPDGASQNFGWSVAVSGDNAIVGAPLTDNFFGAAYMLVRTNANPDEPWEMQELELPADDPSPGGRFGWSVAIDGDFAVVGAFENDGAEQDSGAAYVYVNDGGTWTFQQKLTTSDPSSSQEFGYSVAISGHTIMVGARLDGEAGSSAGAVYVFELDNNGTLDDLTDDSWVFQEKLITAASGDRFGSSVAISGDTAIIGALGRTNPLELPDAGSAFLFLRSGLSWLEMDELFPADARPGDAFGTSVGITDEYAIVGAPLQNADLPPLGENAGDLVDEGAAYIFGVNLSSPPPASNPAITVTPSPIDFGSISAEEISDISVLIENTGDVDLSVRDITSTLGGSLAISETTFDLPIGAVTKILLTLTPANSGGIKETLTISTDNTDLPEVTDFIVASAYLPAADVTGDNVINIFDLTFVASQFASPNPNLAADVNGDGVVNIFDLVLIGSNLGFTIPATPAMLNAASTANFSKSDIENIRRALTELESMNNPPQGALVAINFLRTWLQAAHPIVTETKLLSNYPNPFNPETWIPYQLADATTVEITIYRFDGQQIRTLRLGTQSRGAYISKDKAGYWDGRNDAGERVASGVYYYQFRAGDYAATRKMTILK